MHAGKRTKVVHSGGIVHPGLDGTTYITAGTGGQDLYTTWYGHSSAGDAGTGTPHVWRFSGGDGAGGVRGTGHASNHVDTVTNYSAYRSASYCLVTVDVTPAAKGKKTTMRVRALRPEQAPRQITTIVGPTVIDSVTLVRTARG
jgi:hypothetical protein